MRAERVVVFLAGFAALAACKNAVDQNVALAANNMAGADIEALPPDESSATPSNELVNGSDNPDVNDTFNTGNSY